MAKMQTSQLCRITTTEELGIDALVKGINGLVSIEDDPWGLFQTGSTFDMKITKQKDGSFSALIRKVELKK